jgi:hypothetical protein
MRKKPSILLNRNPYEKLQSNYLPKNHDDMMKLLFSNLKPKSTLGSDKFAFMEFNRRKIISWISRLI